MKRSLLPLILTTLALLYGGTFGAQGAITVSPTRTGYVSWQFNNSSIWHAEASGLLLYEWPDSSYPVYYHTRYNAYTVLNLSGVSARISSANLQGTLTASAPWSSGNDQATETLSLWDVSTSASRLLSLPNRNFVLGDGLSIANDLQSGVNYGTASATSAQVGNAFSVSLTMRGIEDLNNARGGYFSIGASPTSGQSETIGILNPTLVMYPFLAPVSGGGGVDFELNEGTISGDGSADLTELGMRHCLRAVAADQQTHDEKFSEVRRRFVFEAGGSTDPKTIWLFGQLDGRLDAGDGTATCNASMQIYDADSGFLGGESYYGQAVSMGLGDPQTVIVDEALMVQAVLTPGRIYEVISRIDLAADLNGIYGSCEANFENTFEVELSGIPEPATVVLLGLGALWVKRRRKG